MQTVAISKGAVARNLVTNVFNECSSTLTSNLSNSRIVNRLFNNLRSLTISATHSSNQQQQAQDSNGNNSSSLNSNNNNNNSNSSTQQQQQQQKSSQQPLQFPQLHLVTAYSGFSKDLSKPLCKKGVIGDDAWFIASQKCVDVLGVADGVGGWREYGVDPSKFSSMLMETCKRLIEHEKININDANVNRTTPIKILSHSYNTLLENKNGIIGSSTACVVVFHRESRYVHAANLGDSGFVIIRNNKIVHRSQEQQHYFNSPFQLAIHPNLNNNLNEDSLISDSPESASTSSFQVVEGDFILVATDGLWDNLPESSVITEISKIKSYLIEDLEKAAQTIAKKAIELAFDPDYISPFAISARKNIGVNIKGGKPDDVTILLARVSR